MKILPSKSGTVIDAASQVLSFDVNNYAFCQVSFSSRKKQQNYFNFQNTAALQNRVIKICVEDHV